VGEREEPVGVVGLLFGGHELGQGDAYRGDNCGVGEVEGGWDVEDMGWKYFLLRFPALERTRWYGFPIGSRVRG